MGNSDDSREFICPFKVLSIIVTLLLNEQDFLLSKHKYIVIVTLEFVGLPPHELNILVIFLKQHTSETHTSQGPNVHRSFLQIIISYLFLLTTLEKIGFFMFRPIICFECWIEILCSGRNISEKKMF